MSTSSTCFSVISLVNVRSNLIHGFFVGGVVLSSSCVIGAVSNGGTEPYTVWCVCSILHTNQNGRIVHDLTYLYFRVDFLFPPRPCSK